MPLDNTVAGSDDEKLHAAAIARFKLAEEAWDDNRQSFLEDKAFLAGDQWPEAVKRMRETQNRPVLVVDKLNQYVNQVINDGRQNRPAVKARPVDDNGDDEIAEVFNGLIRHICDKSNADSAYDCALENAASGGFGFFRILTEYAHEGTFNQDIKIMRVRNPMSVLLDPNFKQADSSDTRYGFFIDEMTKEDFKAEYPKAEMMDWTNDSGRYEADWLTDEMVRVCEYFYIENEDRDIHLLDDGTTVDDETYQLAISEGILVPEIVETRSIPYPSVKWCRLSGAEVLEKRDWLGKYIPIIPVFGNETDLDGKVTYSGMVRMSKDPQRLYNYSRSAFAERVALTPKAPYIAAEGQVADYADEWENANAGDTSVLRYTPESLEGTVLPAPQRQSAVDIPAGFAQDIQISEHDIQGALGMYNASLGEQSNEKSGKAILARQREGDVATFHYHDNLNRAIGYLGTQLVDLIPKIYDSSRVVRILGEDGSSEQVGINPDQQEAVVRGEGKKLYNLNVGKYDVSISAGASYTTKRQESAEAMMMLTQANPDIFSIIGDLMIRNMDWPGADEIADRLKAMLPPQLQNLEGSEDESPEVTQVKQQAQQMMEQMGQQMQQMQQALQQAQAQANTEQEKMQVEKFKAEIEQFKAESDRKKIEIAAVVAQQEAQAKSAAEANRLQIDQFQAEVDAFNSETTRMKANADIEAQGQDATAAAVEAMMQIQGSMEGLFAPEPEEMGENGEA